MDLLQTLSLLVGIIINIFILMSYSTFTNDAECDKKNPRLNCPYFLYKAGKGKLKSTRRLFRGLGFLHLILTICLFLNYYFRIFGIELIKSENSFKMSEVKNTKKKKIIYPFWRFISSILIPAMFNSLFNFESLFYMLALGFNLLGIFLHNFFYGFMLVEVIVRVEVMKNVLLAISKIKFSGNKVKPDYEQSTIVYPIQASCEDKVLILAAALFIQILYFQNINNTKRCNGNPLD